MSLNIAKLFPTITPLGRLILIALSASSTPLSLPALCVATGGTATTLLWSCAASPLAVALSTKAP
jgi:hypothetical protein